MRILTKLCIFQKTKIFYIVAFTFLLLFTFLFNFHSHNLMSTDNKDSNYLLEQITSAGAGVDLNVEALLLKNGVRSKSRQRYLKKSHGLKEDVEVPRILIQGGEDPNPIVNAKREFIKRMMKDAWDDYVKHAWGSNELRPLRQIGSTAGTLYGNTDFGLTIIDSLTTLYIMGLDDELKKARDWIENSYNFSKICESVSTFEVSIRLLGGFLSMYALTSDALYLEKSTEIARALLPAFSTASGIPWSFITPCNNRVEGYVNSLAGAGSSHLEMVYLSRLTQNPIFEDKVKKARQALLNSYGIDGLYRRYVNVFTGYSASNQTSLSGGEDSFYEYLMKSWIQTGEYSDWKSYEEAINSVINKGLMKSTERSNLLYFALREVYSEDSKLFKEQKIFSHLACFAGGMFALGSHAGPDFYKYKQRDMEIGKNLTNTCHESYIRSHTGLGPELFLMEEYSEAKNLYLWTKLYFTDNYYNLRPEVIESYFVLYRITGDSKYRDWGWAAALAIEKYCKVGPGRGYSGIRNVDAYLPFKEDVQQSFFLAETLKYLYLLFSSPELIDLKYWVFNTEAHPLPIKGTNPMFSP